MTLSLLNVNLQPVQENISAGNITEYKHLKGQLETGYLLSDDLNFEINRWESIFGP